MNNKTIIVIRVIALVPMKLKQNTFLKNIRLQKNNLIRYKTNTIMKLDMLIRNISIIFIVCYYTYNA